MIASTNASTGAIEGSIRSYDAFGLEMGFITSDVSGRGYTGHEQVNNPLDAEFGLINMNARLYDPEIGRFISADTIVPDPLNMQGYNRYSYVINNPLKYIDPTGHGWFGAFKRNISKRIRWTKIRGKAIGGTLMVAGAAISLSGFPEFGVPIMSSGAYLGGWTNGAEANVGNASWGSLPGGGTSITYGSIFGGGSYSSSGGWSYNGYSGGAGSSLGGRYSGNISLNGMDGVSSASGSSPSLAHEFGVNPTNTLISPIFSALGSDVNTVGISLNQTKGASGRGGTGGLLFAIDRQGGMALFTTVGLGKFAGMDQSRTLNIEWSNALTVSDLEGLGWQGGGSSNISRAVAIEGGVMGGGSYTGGYTGAGKSIGSQKTGGVFLVDTIMLWSNRK